MGNGWVQGGEEEEEIGGRGKGSVEMGGGGLCCGRGKGWNLEWEMEIVDRRRVLKEERV